MNRYCTISLAMLAGTLAFSATPADREAAASQVTGPPVLQGSEPSDSVLVTLPGRRRPVPVTPAAVPAATTPVVPATAIAPATHTGPTSGPVSSAYLKQTVPSGEDQRPILRRPPKPILPAEFERDSAAFCQKRIGQWTKPDAYNLFGDPLRDRPSYSETRTENGTIYAFSDPTGRYRALELDFAADTGILRTVFVYPWSMTWMECRRLWGGNVTATEANHGRTFYSYVNRHLDVLVESGGKVISLGLY